MDLSVFATPEAWISLITLIFLEIVLGVANLVFISITTNRLPEEKQHIGRKLCLEMCIRDRAVRVLHRQVDQGLLGEEGGEHHALRRLGAPGRGHLDVCLLYTSRCV